MTSSAKQSRRSPRDYPAIKKLTIHDDVITASLDDGREVSIPIAWSPALSNATKDQLAVFEIDTFGYGIHWPDLDEDISIRAFIDGWR
jgi:hypothetical protein